MAIIQKPRIIQPHVTPFYPVACPTLNLTPWEQWVPMQKEVAYDMLWRDLPDDVTVEIAWDKENPGQGNIYIRSADIDESRSFDLKNHVVNAGYITLRKKGTGIGRKIMRNEIEFFSACGAKKFEICASLSAGGYTWARFGFLPTTNDEDQTAKFNLVKRQVLDRYKAIECQLNNDEKKMLEPYIRLKTPTDLWHVADADFNIRPILRRAFNKASSDERRKLRQCIKLVGGLNDCPVETYLKSDAPLPAGRYMLAVTSWYGELDFDNKEQMARVEKYVGGFSHPLGTRPSRKKAGVANG